MQRDYVQGNQHDKIEPFIEYLLDGLNSDKGIDLNYIYGIEDDKKETFSPIDGQQRLTTLCCYVCILYPELISLT